MADGVYRTDDLALAVFLSVNKFEYTLDLLTKRTAIWAFAIPEERDDDFDSLIEDYDSFEAKTEPRKFVARWAEMRRELFALVPPATGRRATPAV